MTCPPQRAWIRWQDRIKTTASAIVSFLLKWDLSIVQSHIPILFKSAQVKYVFLQKLWQPSFEMVWSQSGHWWYRWLVEKWRQGSTEEDWPGQISQMERDVISKTEIILPLKSSNVGTVYSINSINIRHHRRTRYIAQFGFDFYFVKHLLRLVPLPGEQESPGWQGVVVSLPNPPLALKSFKSMWDRETDWAGGGRLLANKKMPSNFLLPQIC